MSFSSEQKALFEKNRTVLRNQILKEKLLKLKPSSFEVKFEGGESDLLALNFLHKPSGRFVYENPLLELEEKLQIFQNKFLLYPVLYFYGFGNGVLLKTLLKNSHLKHLIVFEDELEILYLAFHFLDFSEELKSGRLFVFENDLSGSEFDLLLSKEVIFNFSKLYFLNPLSEFYTHKGAALDDKIKKAFENKIFALGNSIEDSFQGITQFVANLPSQLCGASFDELIKQRKAKVQTALIVSTGPSLTKQLPLLKAHQDKFSIICADSAYSILAQHDIKPDYVVMCERSIETAQVIKKAHANIDDGVIFVLSVVAHPQALHYLKESGRRFVLAPYRGDVFIDSFHFGENFLEVGNTVAYNALMLACLLHHENILFIGQDLAYGEGGVSHPKEYFWGQEYESETEREFAPAYGGKGVVSTHFTWNYFRYYLECLISELCVKFHIYNATEGGARIAGTEEKPFLWCIENLCDESLKKPFLALTLQSVEEQNAQLTKVATNLKSICQICEDFVELFSKTHEDLSLEFARLKLTQDKAHAKDLIAQIDAAKLKLDDFNQKPTAPFYKPYMRHFELNLAQILAFNPQNEEQWWEKNLLFITQHLEFFQILPATVAKFKEGLEQNAHALKLELKKRGIKSPF